MDQEKSFQHMIIRLRGGDDAAAGEVVARFSRRLAGLAHGRMSAQLRQKIDAEDVLQSVFKSFFIRHADGQFEPTGWDSLWTLLSVIAVRKCCKHHKFFHAERRAIDRETQAHDQSSLVWEPFDREPTPDEAAAVADTVEQLMRGLDDRGRQILSLRLQGGQFEEIAGEVGCAERTVRRVLDRVKTCLQQLEEQTEATSSQETNHG
ncbi:MAG: RNA polymerase sigma factor [Gemmataceae bacterium]